MSIFGGAVNIGEAERVELNANQMSRTGVLKLLWPIALVCALCSLLSCGAEGNDWASANKDTTSTMSTSDARQKSAALEAANSPDARALITAYARGHLGVEAIGISIDLESVVPVYRIKESFIANGGSVGEIGTLDYIAVSVYINYATLPDTLRLSASGHDDLFTPTAVSSGDYERQASRKVSDNGRLLLNAQVWFQWDDQGLLVIDAPVSGLVGQRIDPERFRK